MACATCDSMVIFGGKRSGKRRYCNQVCFDMDKIGRISDEVSDNDATNYAKNLKVSTCPVCSENKELEIHKSYFVVSIILITKWKTIPILACHSCAKKTQTKDLFLSSFLGWWGFPFGLIVTPIIMVSNIMALFKKRDPNVISGNLLEFSRYEIAREIRDEHFRKLDEEEALNS